MNPGETSVIVEDVLSSSFTPVDTSVVSKPNYAVSGVIFLPVIDNTPLGLPEEKK